ncbi:VanW family protein [Enterocloster citroniae]|uniref:VanW family protein n=1 Tax=Enterocloster citroniae TaxID=358743 RepID=UPI00349EAB3D
MRKGRARRRYHYRKNGYMWGRIWLLSALAAAAVIYGVMELRSVRGHEAEGVQVSLETSGSSPDAESPDTAGPAPQSKKEGREDQEQTKRESRSIQVVDVKDVVEIEVPAQWAEDLDTHAIKAELTKKAAEIAEKWDRQPVDSQMESFDKTTGSYGYSEESNGRALDQDQLVRDLMKAVEGPLLQTQVQAVFQTVAPKRTRAQAKEQYKVIGTFATTTTNNKNRNQNIRLAAEAIDGMILKPGQEFSFNMTTGNRTSDKGYQPAGAYRNGVLIEEPGGGVCQVSTTLYHAIINSGFKTTERNFHSFAPSYIEKGQDAMVSFDGYAGPDLRFVNTGDASVGLRASFSGNQLKLSIVGLPVLENGKDVSLRSEKVRDVEPPEPIYEENPELAYGEEKVIEQAQPGSVWKTYRQLKENGKVVEETALHTSTYKAKPARIQRNSAAQPGANQEQTGMDQEQTGTGQEQTGTGQEQTGTGQEHSDAGQEHSDGNTPESVQGSVSQDQGTRGQESQDQGTAGQKVHNLQDGAGQAEHGSGGNGPGTDGPAEGGPAAETPGGKNQGSFAPELAAPGQ